MKFKVGDLIYDRDFPEDGYALIIEVREPNRKNPLVHHRLHRDRM